MTTSYLFRCADAETPKWSGTALTLASVPTPALSLQLFRNGILQTQGSDYTLAAACVTLKYPYDPTDKYIAWYRF